MIGVRRRRGEITTDTAEIQKTLRGYYEQLYANKFDNLEEMDNFLETYSPPKLKKKRIGNLNRQITRNGIESVIKKQNKTPYKQKPRVRWLHWGIPPTYKEELILILLKLFQKIKEEGIFPKTFYETTITMIPKPDKDTTKKENYRPISLMNIDTKILNKILANRVNHT